MASTDNSKSIITIITSVLVATIALVLLSMEVMPVVAITVIVPIIAYVVSFLMAALYQYTKCNTLNISAAALSTLFVLGTTSITSLVLFLEDIPFLDSIFGSFPPRNPVSGLPYGEQTPEYILGMNSKTHYKLQFLTSIVKAVLPVYLSDSMKTGFVYFYWMFWMTILPLFFVLSVTGSC